MQGCLACEHGITVNLGRKQTFECRQTTLPSLVSRQLVDGEIQRRWHKVLKRHEHEDDVEHRDAKRVHFTHKQPDNRGDTELTDDTVAKRTKMFDKSSFSSSSHETAPNLHDSSGEIRRP